MKNKNKYILKFEEISKDQIDVVGGKGANLGELVRAGFPVPNGFCISVKAYTEFVGTDLQEQINKIIETIKWDDPVDIEIEARKIKESFMQRTIPTEIAKDIKQAYLQLSGNENQSDIAVAVRSSATAEDLPDASFAGQQESYLYIKGTDNVLEHVKKCWASLWTARAILYRHRHNYDQNKVLLSVVVQEMVEADSAGVVFTVNPLIEKPEELLINSAYGLGEVVVAGTVTPDSFVITKKDFVVTKKNWELKKNS